MNVPRSPTACLSQTAGFRILNAARRPGWRCEFRCGWLCVALAALLLLGMRGEVAGQPADAGEYPLHDSMPTLPQDPAQYLNMWDPFAVRGPAAGEPLEVPSESASQVRLLGGFDLLPWNGRQIVRDANGNWLVLISQSPQRIVLAGAAGSADNPYRPRGGDLAALELVGSGDNATIASPRAVSRASMAIDGRGRLHVIWHRNDGIWHASASLAGGGLAELRGRQIWSEPRRLVDRACRAGDILCDASGEIAISYAIDDAVYYLPLGGQPERFDGVDPARPSPQQAPNRGPGAKPAMVDDAEIPELKRVAGRVPQSERECQDPVMDLAPDGSIYLAYRRDFALWVARRTPAGEWQQPELAAREYIFHPSIVIVNDQPLVTFHHEGLRRIPLDLAGNLLQRAGGGSSIGYAVRGNDGWRTGLIARAEEIVVRRRGMWEKRGTGQMFAQIEQFGWPVLCRDPRGVVWAFWQNTSRRWIYSARWLGETFGEVQECRGPFNAPRLAMHAEKHAPAGANDMGLMFHAAAAGGLDRILFDRLRIPALSTLEDREVFFLDSLEVAGTTGVEFVLNSMTKPAPVPALSPLPGDRVVWMPKVARHGGTYVMRYSVPEGDAGDGPSREGWAISQDGVRFTMVDQLPADLPPAETGPTRPLDCWRGSPAYFARPYYPNPNPSDPASKFLRLSFSVEARGTYWIEYSPNGRDWVRGPQATAVEALRERAMPGYFNANDPERPIRAYSRVYTETGRSWGVAWTKDLFHWSGVEHLLDPDHPYEHPPAESKIGNTGKSYTLRGQIFLDSVAGKDEDEIYAASVRPAEGLYFCFYWPGKPGRPLTDVGLAVSRDGFNFTRVKNGHRVLHLGPPGAWDAGRIFQMSPLIDGDRVHVYYRGTAASREGTDGFEHNLTEIGYATIRVNSWTYYTPRSDQSEGTVTTIPIQSPADARRRLVVNFEPAVRSAGQLAVELLDAATNEPLPGFARADCRVLTTGGLAVPVSWQAGSELPAGRGLRIRFHLTEPETRLYSFAFQDASQPDE